jgi:3-dehydroquinate dehydratase/shikimate dehydrogenase
MTQLCVPIFVHSLEQARRDALLAAEAGADLVEYRIDQFTNAADIHILVSNSPLPCIITLRSEEEGGQCELSDEERLAILETPGPAQARYLDLEYQTFKRHPSTTVGGYGSLILSSHDFKGRPDRLYNLIAEMTAAPANVVKIVWTARTLRDNLEAFEILLTRQKPTIALCMGEAGILSRILGKKFGAFLSFASLSEAAETAPGQISIRDMKGLYRWDAINPETKVFGVVGSPIMHSMSPAIHNAAFDDVGFDGIYVPLLVNQGYESFKAFMETFVAFAPLNLGGLSITIPHKENALRYLKEKGAQIDQLAQSIGALNTIVIQSSRLQGFSTDYSAILDSITAKLGITREQLKNYRIAVLGAGGTGRTAVAALANFGATVVIYNRTHEKAEALAAEFNGRSGKVVAAKFEKLCDSCCQIFINTTSVGMHPNADASPIDGMNLKFTRDTLVFDAIYNPINTRLLQTAEAAGASTINGVEMFVRQAAGQFEAWTNKTAPVELMRRVVEERLKEKGG